MALTKFLEPGGDATFNVATTTNGGFWEGEASGTLATDFVHGTHIKSIKYAIGATSRMTTPTSVVSTTGSGISFYMIDGVVSIVDIAPNSPGELNGFKVDDVILSIDHKIVVDLQTIKDNFEMSQSKHIIGIVRANQLIEMPIY